MMLFESIHFCYLATSGMHIETNGKLHEALKVKIIIIILLAIIIINGSVK